MRRRLLGALLLAAFALPAVAAREPETAAYRWHSVTVGDGDFAPGHRVQHRRAGPGLSAHRHERCLSLGGQSGGLGAVMDGFVESSYFGFESIAPDPVDPDRVYAAAGMHYRGASAILRSDNKGQHWTVVPVSFRMGGNENDRGLGERLAAMRKVIGDTVTQMPTHAAHIDRHCRMPTDRA